MSWYGSFWVHLVWDSVPEYLYLYQNICFLLLIWKVFSHNLKYIFDSFRDPYNVHVNVLEVQRSFKVFSFNFFFFLLFSWVIFIILSFRSLTCSSVLPSLLFFLVFLKFIFIYLFLLFNEFITSVVV